MIEHGINADYFEWLYEGMCGDRYSKNVSYRKLLERLHNINFRYTIPNDRNRANDGKNLRYSFAVAEGCEDNPEMITEYLEGPCSVFEMMVALAQRCESVMDDPKIGDRTGQWFWGMIANLGLNGMVDYKYDEDFVDEKIRIFLNREYEPNGRGGLFYIRGCNKDLRKVAIYHQMCWYLDTIV